MNTKTQVTRSGTKIMEFNYLQTLAADVDDFDFENSIATGPSEHSNSQEIPNHELADVGKKIFKVMGAYDTGWQIDDKYYDLKTDRSRFPIGIRDIYLGSTKYKKKGQLVTKPYKFPGTLAKVQMHANMFIPNGFDRNKDWIKFYIFCESQKQQINPINNLYSANTSIPRTIYFNVDPDTGENDAMRIDTENPITELRAGFDISRPDSNDNITPILKGFRFKATIL